MAIFNFLEPAVAIIAQAIPMFRVLVVKARKGSEAVCIGSPTDGNKPSMQAQQMRAWNSKMLGADLRERESDEELLRLRAENTIQSSTGSGTRV
jgi:hypothetical protein